LAQQAGKPALPANPVQLVRTVVQNEMANNQYPPMFTWKERIQKPSRTVEKQYVRTPSGILGCYLTINGKPLSAEDRAADDLRLNRLKDPRQMASKRKEQKQDEERVSNIVRALPDAFRYEYAGVDIAANSHTLVHLRFTPNPSFNPPSRETFIFQGMNGMLTIDQSVNRILKLEGTLFRDVSIGWGIIGRLNQGGRFAIEQGDVSHGHWDQTHLRLDFYGKAFIFKSIRINEYDTQYDFQPVPVMSVEQALDYLHRSYCTEYGGRR
jgi:hypothetical protein